jgi:hypothetical protein
LTRTFSSPARRLSLLGALLAAGAVALSVAQRRDPPAGAPAGGDVSGCARLVGDAARDCHGSEVGRELAAVGGGPKVTIAVSADSARVTFASTVEEPEVTFASTGEAPPLLCDLHARVGVVDAQVPSWLSWTESPAATTPQS